MSITPGKLRGLTQPTIILRMEASVPEAPGESELTVFGPGDLVYAQYVGNGRLLLTPVGSRTGYGSHVVMASALNGTASVVDGDTVVEALRLHEDIGRVDYWPPLPSGTTVVDDAEDQFKFRRVA